MSPLYRVMRLISRGALFRGISPSLLRAAPAAASTFVAFELTRGVWNRKDAGTKLIPRLYCQSRPPVSFVRLGPPGRLPSINSKL